MMTDDEERIDFERAVVEQGVRNATERFCDMLLTAELVFTDLRAELLPDYRYSEKFCQGDLIDLGKSSARSIIDCLVDDMPIDFRRVLTAVLERDEWVENEDDITDRIEQGLKDRIKGVLDGCA